ncbi:uncharacterized protein LOC116106733 [Pistacia vera]|uniref:uncharacterized protein LOC116106733 n=1 Tax=Pistacia vera TaxID=55513 RepID=UPI001263A723|nr:uncharacterized protein LOC116106733 [Pistacia vera]
MGETIVIDGHEFDVDLIAFDMPDFDMILGMDFLSKYGVFIDLRAMKMIRKGCTGYIANVVNKEKFLDFGVWDVPIVQEFEDVFPEDLLGLPPEREVEFCIELALGMAPISKAPYRMALAELQELKKQLQELLDKCFIRPSHSP